MKSKSLALCFASLASAVPMFAGDPPSDGAQPPQKWESSGFNLVPRSMQKDPRLDISVVTEMSADGRALPHPSASKPTYVMVIDGGEKDSGDVNAGERPPPPKALHNAMLQAMRVNGYLPADRLHPPTQLIEIVWGYYNQLTFGDVISNPQGTDLVMNDLQLQQLGERAAIVGGIRFAADMMKAYNQGQIMFRMFKGQAHNEWLADVAEGNLYFIIATSYDFAAASKDVKKVLWRTKMSTDSDGVTMDESVPTLVANSGAYFGKESPAVRLDRPALKDGHVEIGIPTVKASPDSAIVPEGEPPDRNK